MMPMARAPLILLMLIQFTWVWNDLLFGLVLTKSRACGRSWSRWPARRASMAPATALPSSRRLWSAARRRSSCFLALQRYFVRGLTLGMGER